jgi:hypothetical protein
MQRLVTAKAVHPSAQYVNRKTKGRTTPWSETESTPVGLCATKREVAFIENGHFTCSGGMEGDLALQFKVGEISQMCVPIFEFQRRSMPEMIKHARRMAGTAEVETAGCSQGKLLGVLRCLNKYAASSSRAGQSFLASDAALASLFASLIAEQAALEVRRIDMAVKVQQAYRSFRAKYKGAT